MRKSGSGIKHDFIAFHLRSFTMVFALLAIWVFFTILSHGVFLEPRNLSNLIREMTVIAFLAIGMVMIIVSGNIDLSVGSLVGLAGAVAALVQVKWLGPFLFELFPHSRPETLSVLISLAAVFAAALFSSAVGFFQGFCVAYGGVPSFIVTLAGMLILRGIILGITNGITIGPMEPFFKSLGQAYIPAPVGWASGLIVAIVTVTLLWNRRRKAFHYELASSSRAVFVASLFLSFAAILSFVWLMNTYRGIPIPVLVVLALSVLMIFVGNHTPFGRSLYAIGGNEKAARLSGIPIHKTLLINFVIMGLLAGVSGIILTARLDAATTNAGNLLELSAIAACVIGGSSLSGGKGTVYGALIGALVMASLDNGMSLLNVQVFWQQIIKGLVLLLAVWADTRTKKQNYLS